MSDPVYGTTGNGQAMIGNTETTADAAAAVAAGVAEALASWESRESKAGAFIVEYGAQVVDGHGEVTVPKGEGRPGEFGD
jgi:hypothetical protein